MLLMLNLDDIEVELLPLHIQKLLQKGAKNTYYVHSVNKKGRNGILLFVDVEEDCADAVIEYLAVEVGTIGIRIIETKHIPFDYEVRKVILTVGDRTFGLSVKFIYRGRGKHVKVEYEDLRQVSESLFIPAEVLKKIVEGFSFSDDRVWDISLGELSLHLEKE